MRATRRRGRLEVLVAAGAMVITLVVGVSTAAAATTLSVTPSSGLDGGDTVTVAGGGLTSGADAGYCQGVPAPEGTPASESWCGVGVNGSGPVAGDGTFGGPLRVQRFLYVPAVADWVDCTIAECTVGAADRADIAGTAAAAPIQFAAPPPPPSTRGSVALSATDVHPEELVTVTGSGFRPDQPVDVYQCLPGAGAPEAPSSCALATAAATTDSSGRFSVGVALHQVITDPRALVGQGGSPYDCVAAPSGPCRVAVAELVDFPGTAVAVPVTMEVEPVLTPGAVSVAEGDSGTSTLEVPVTLSAPSGRPVTASWSTIHPIGAPGHQADPGTDYVQANGTVTFAPGETTETVAISVHGDTVPEPDEYVVVSFTNPTNARMGGYWGLGFGTILDDDTPPVFTPGSAQVTEGDAGTVVLHVPVSLSRPWGQPFSVDWETASQVGPGYADPGTDFADASGTVTFAPGETAKTVDVVVYGDTVQEPAEQFAVVFCTGGFSPCGTIYGFAVATIVDDDPVPTVLPGVASVTEGDVGTTELVVPVTLSNPSSETVTVSFTTRFVPGAPGDQADPSTDYTAVSGTVTFAPGQTAKSVSILVHGDLTGEPDEYVVVSFNNPTHARMGGFWGLGFGVVTNDD